MWTTENRARYDRSKLRYPSDLTDAAFLRNTHAGAGASCRTYPSDLARRSRLVRTLRR